MTRAELLWALAGYTFPPVSQVGVETWQRLHDYLAAELDKTCATCEHFDIEGPTSVCCAPGNWVTVPSDGSGFCHRWERLDTEATPPVDSSSAQD